MQQDEYEELFRYTAVTPKLVECVSKLPEPAPEKRAPDRISGVTDDPSHHKIPGSVELIRIMIQL